MADFFASFVPVVPGGLLRRSSADARIKGYAHFCVQPAYVTDEYAVGPGGICNKHNRPLKAGEATIQRCRAWAEENKLLVVYT